MSEPAYINPDEEGQFHLRIAGEEKTYQVEGPDDNGRYWLCEILPWDSVPVEIRQAVEHGETHPERWVSRPRPQ